MVISRFRLSSFGFASRSHCMVLRFAHVAEGGKYAKEKCETPNNIVERLCIHCGQASPWIKVVTPHPTLFPEPPSDYDLFKLWKEYVKCLPTVNADEVDLIPHAACCYVLCRLLSRNAEHCCLPPLSCVLSYDVVIDIVDLLG